MNHWAYDAIFYHIYPLGLCGAPARNNFGAPPVPRLEELHAWIPHLRELGVNALYLGPLFEATAHGYDTADYYRVDRRLGDTGTLARLSEALHRDGIRLILDGVFNHVGRDFWAFRDLLEHGERSAYRDWFRGVDFGARSPYGDPFAYEGWSGYYELVALNLHHPAVREHLLGAVELWMQEFAIDGLRLDVADDLDRDFQRALASFCRARRPDFWLLGEVIHGDYREWVNGELLDSVTNYECYKGLYSSHVDRNYYEIAYALTRQFGEDGIYRGLPLYAFADNHDVNRVASNLTHPAHLYPLYCLLFTMPGVPSIYYGSEWGLAGRREKGSDAALRPHVVLHEVVPPHPELAGAIARLARVRRELPALRRGDYLQLALSHEQLAFARRTPEQTAIVAINAAAEPVALEFAVPGLNHGRLTDALNPGDVFPVQGGHVRLDPVAARWGRVLVWEALT